MQATGMAAMLRLKRVDQKMPMLPVKRTVTSRATTSSTMATGETPPMMKETERTGSDRSSRAKK